MACSSTGEPRLTRLGPGELLVRLPVDGSPVLTLLREAQQDMAVAVDGGRTDPSVPEDLAKLLQTLTSASTIRRLTFNSFKDLHTFQLAVTGFSVKFDGYVCIDSMFCAFCMMSKVCLY